jgi:hypothetical protein
MRKFCRDLKEKRHANKLTTVVAARPNQCLVDVMLTGSALENSENGSKALFDLRN